jgi:hypothetical protein
MTPHNPQQRCTSNGIDFSYSEENRMLSCHVRFMKLVVNSAADVTSWLPSAAVIGVSIGVFPDALFHYNGILYEVVNVNVNNHLVRCRPVQDFDIAKVMLPVQEVENLVAQFGT